jgi:hypothetical protein
MEAARSSDNSLNSYQTTRSHLRHNFKSARVTRRYSTAVTWKQVVLLRTFEIITAVSMEIWVFWDLTPRSFVPDSTGLHPETP